MGINRITGNGWINPKNGWIKFFEFPIFIPLDRGGPEPIGPSGYPEGVPRVSFFLAVSLNERRFPRYSYPTIFGISNHNLIHLELIGLKEMVG